MSAETDSQETAPGWGSSAVMTDFEAMMWRAEADPRLRATGVVLDVLDRAPDWERLVDAHRWGVSLVPRLGQKVVEDPLHLGPPVWTTDPAMDLAYHLRRVSAPAPGGLAEVLTIAESFAMTPLDPARPLWEALLVEGMADGGAAYLLKLHHCLTDGQAMVQLFDLLHSPTAEPRPDKPMGEGPPPPSAGSDRARTRLGASLEDGRAALGRAAGATGAFVARPVASASGALRYARSLARVAGNTPAKPSPLFVDRGLPRRLATLSIPFADLRAAAKSVDSSLNDAFLAAIAGGLRRYHEAHGVAVDELTIAFPVSTRDASDPMGGNRFSGARIAAPVSVVDPAERMGLIRERALAVRDEPALDFLAAVAPVMARIPGPALTRLTSTVTRSIDLQASNIPGLRRAAYIAGARITAMYPFGPVPGPAVMVTLISHDGTCCIGVTMDAVAIPDGARFLDALRKGFDEVLGLAGLSVPPSAAVIGVP